MKNLKIALTVILLIMCYSSSFSQNLKRFYKLNGATIIQECDINGEINSYNKKLAPSGAKFTIIGTKVEKTDSQSVEFYLINFWSWNDDGYSDTTKKEKLIKSHSRAMEFNYKGSSRSAASSDQRYFRIPKSSLDQYAEELVAKWTETIGAITLPFKYRPQGGTIKKDLAISGMGGLKRNYYNGKFSLNILGGIGLSSVNLDSLNTRGNVLESQDRSAVTFSTGLVFQWNKLQIGIFTGWDWLTTPNNDKWSYHGKNWLSLGIGISLFSSESTVKSEGEN